MLRWNLWIIPIVLTVCKGLPAFGNEPENKQIGAFFAAYCNKCHSGEKPKGEFRTDASLKFDFQDLATKGKWKEIVNVLNSHEMPPKAAKQPEAKEVAQVVDWVTEQIVRVELQQRDKAVVLRRMNREEYKNTIRELIGIDFDVSGFPQDPPAGGFDNNGSALSLSPLHLEVYLNAAKQILDRALVEGDQPKPVKWHFTPRVGPADRTRINLDDKNKNIIVNGGNNTESRGYVVMHHDSWDKHVSSRGFKVPVAGEYVIRVKAAGHVPTREEVVESAEKILKKRQNEQDEKNPKGAKYHAEAYSRDLLHFKTDRIYDYGPPRLKLVLQLGPQPKTIAEFDCVGKLTDGFVHQIRTRFTTEQAGVTFEYAYSIPRVLENFWMQGNPTFARPEAMISWFQIEGPLYDAWPPTSHTRILFQSPLAQNDETKYAEEVLSRFMRNAYRRPVSDDEVASKLALYQASRKNSSFQEAIKLALISVLTSPNFLFLMEQPANLDGKQAQRLNPHEFATRLSYFLWSSMPDSRLSQLADTGKLNDPQVLNSEVDRMLADNRSEAFVKNFAGQWLGLRDVGNNPPATDLYPQYDRDLETSMVRESEAFFSTILREKLPARTFIKSDFVTINGRLARFYGISGVKGDVMRKVKVPEGVHRGGIVTQASILTITSNGTRTSPVKRGTWIMKTLLGIDPGLPVANAGEIAPKVPGIDKATVRKRLEIHRQLDQCARCHNKIDPLGFALENYNAAGEWREQEGFGYKGRIGRDDPKIDASSEMIDGTKIVGVEGLQNAMLAREELFLKCLANKLFTYALGRELGLADQPEVKRAVQHMNANGQTIQSLIQHIVTSDVFQSK
jgi:hypothetical protein